MRTAPLSAALTVYQMAAKRVARWDYHWAGLTDFHSAEWTVGWMAVRKGDRKAGWMVEKTAAVTDCHLVGPKDRQKVGPTAVCWDLPSAD